MKKQNLSEKQLPVTETLTAATLAKIELILMRGLELLGLLAILYWGAVTR